jgi:hypothetical protein
LLSFTHSATKLIPRHILHNASKTVVYIGMQLDKVDVSFASSKVLGEASGAPLLVCASHQCRPYIAASHWSCDI